MTDGDRGGFTLAELAVAVMIVGILAGLALPNIRSALFRADAAHIMGDVHVIQGAAHRVLTETGSFPSAGGVGTVPSEMEYALPEEFEFAYKDVDYMWTSISLPSTFKVFGSSDLGLLWIMYAGQPDLANAMKAHQGTLAFWSTTQMIFIFPG